MIKTETCLGSVSENAPSVLHYSYKNNGVKSFIGFWCNLQIKIATLQEYKIKDS